MTGEEQTHKAVPNSSELVEVWFNIEKDSDGYPESKDREGLLTRPEREAFRVVSVPFYLKNVSRGDLVAAVSGKFFEFSQIIERGGHNTYRLLLTKVAADDVARTVAELINMGLGVEEENGMLLAVDVPPSVEQTQVDSYLVEQSKLGRWQI